MNALEKNLIILVAVLITIFATIVGFQFWPQVSGSAGQNLFAQRVECDSDAVTTYVTELDKVLNIWDDNLKLAASTSRIALSGVVNSLLSSKHRLMDTQRPECATYITELATLMMDKSIESFLAFMQERGEEEIYTLMYSAAISRHIFESELTKFRENPVSAYHEANFTIASEPHYASTDGWKMSQGGAFQFYLPPEWESNPSELLDMTFVSSKSSNLHGTISMHPDSEASLNRSVPINFAMAGIEGHHYGIRQTREYHKLGSNEVYLNYLDSDKISGLAISPDDIVFAFQFSTSTNEISEQMKETIFAILASLE